MNYLTIEFPSEQRQNFITESAVDTNEQLIAVVNELCDRTKSEKCIIGVWEDEERTFIKKFLPINQKSGFTDTQHEYFAAVTWQKMVSERFVYLLKQLPEYGGDSYTFDVAVMCEDAVDKQIGYSRAIEYLKETEDRLLEESHAEIKKLPGYNAQAASLEMLFERAKSDLMVHGSSQDG